MIRIGIVGVGASSNVGDRLIAKCLGCMIKQIDSTATVDYYDLFFGRYSPDAASRSCANTAFKLAKEKRSSAYLPRFAKELLKSFLSRKIVNEELDAFLRDKDLILIGGGHLLIDNYGSFGIRLRQVIKKCQILGVERYFWSVGVGGHFSKLWWMVLGRSIRSIPLYTRDATSLSRARKFKVGVARKAIIDPAFFVPSFVPSIERESVGSVSVCLFIMDPFETLRHGGKFYSRENIAEWWSSVITALKKDYEVVIANNGSQADYNFIRKYVEPRLKGLETEVLPRAVDYSDVIEPIMSCDFVLAQRLHAVIPALAYGKEVIGIKWDQKLESVLSDIGMQHILIEYCTEPSEISKLFKQGNNALSIQRLDKFKDVHVQELREVIKN